MTVKIGTKTVATTGLIPSFAWYITSRILLLWATLDGVVVAPADLISNITGSLTVNQTSASCPMLSAQIKYNIFHSATPNYTTSQQSTPLKTLLPSQSL